MVEEVQAVTEVTRSSIAPYGALASWVLGFMLHNRPKREML